MQQQRSRRALVSAVGSALVGSVLMLFAVSAPAIDFTLPSWDDEQIEGVLNTTITAGAAIRTQARSSKLVGKANNNPNVCGRIDVNGQQRINCQTCQGLFCEQSFPAQYLADARGQFLPNFDDGNLNDNKGDLVQAPLKITQDLSLKWGRTGLLRQAPVFL